MEQLNLATMNRPCSKVKNPCKICCDAVTKKTGIQCHGACQKWAHFKCLNYTPGKIDDIKAGIIRVNCPCPDCNNSDEKKNMCKTTECPAKKPPVCPQDRREIMKPIPNYPPAAEDQKDFKCSYLKCPQCPKCTSPDNKNSHSTSPNLTLSDSFIKCRPQCPQKKPPVKRSYSNCVISKSCDSGINITCIPSRTASSDSKLSKASEVNQKDLFVAVEKMCTTVGQLSNQLKELLCKIKETR